MNKVILVFNAGSSSVKFSIFSIDDNFALTEKVRGAVSGLGAKNDNITFTTKGEVSISKSIVNKSSIEHDYAIEVIVNWITENLANTEVLCVGHRVVHGGVEYQGPIVLDADKIRNLEKLATLAPMHQQHCLSGIRKAREIYPNIRQVACFDTSFHRGVPSVARMYAIPRHYIGAGIIRYGFHGLSYEYLSQEILLHDGKLEHAKVALCHLGSGSSICAMKGGKSVYCSMGFSVIEGLPMGTRSGSIDPGVIIYIQKNYKMSVDEVETLLYEQSGLLGLSERSNDIRDLVSSEELKCKEAVDYYVYQIACELGKISVMLQGLDAIVFSGGIGENQPVIRNSVVKYLNWLGVFIDTQANEGNATMISSKDSNTSLLVIPANEELVIAEHALNLC